SERRRRGEDLALAHVVDGDPSTAHHRPCACGGLIAIDDGEVAQKRLLEAAMRDDLERAGGRIEELDVAPVGRRQRDGGVEDAFETLLHGARGVRAARTDRLQDGHRLDGRPRQSGRGSIRFGSGVGLRHGALWTAAGGAEGAEGYVASYTLRVRAARPRGPALHLVAFLFQLVADLPPQ